MNFYEFSQNNTGGSFETNSTLCHRLFIEAENAEQANDKAEDLGCYWDGVDNGTDCPCCGDRWYKAYGIIYFPMNYDGKGMMFNNIWEYAQYLANKYGQTSPDCRIFYSNGDVKEIFSQTKTN